MNALRIARFLLLAALAAGGVSARAGIPEPDTVLYGSIALDGAFVTAARSDVVVELRALTNGPVLASYRMGTSAAAGNRYVLRVKSEHLAPVTEADAVALGTTVLLTLRDATGVRDSRTHTLTGRGEFVALNFGDVDTDGDGMSDTFETTHFGSATGGDPNADPDLDGRPNRREFLQGTDPRVPDGRHPADIAPADDRLTIQEVTDYILAWKTGATNWPVEPSLDAPNIVDYVTRAGALWKGGEIYVFDNLPPTNAPMWWVNPPASPASPALAAVATPSPRTVAALGTPQAGSVDRVLPASYRPLESVRVRLEAAPTATTRAYAVIETPPEGWLVRQLSHDGRWDAARRQIKWGPFFDTEKRTLTYETVPLSTRPTAASFAGRGSFDGFGVVAAGAAELWAPGVQPARLRLAWQPAAGTLAIEVQGGARLRYVLETSPDLTTWTPFESLTLDATGTSRLVVPDDPTSARFFRLRAIE